MVCFIYVNLNTLYVLKMKFNMHSVTHIKILQFNRMFLKAEPCFKNPVIEHTIMKRVTDECGLHRTFCPLCLLSGWQCRLLKSKCKSKNMEFYHAS
jgi:hypothetical protein